ncbi:hypothetical protein DRH27_01130 [Candidatus Falkowbacteria bacterium]|nr:MAG: hypothetical protein DRH27_01130 [Candidatus Falkowbacteria bacterium]
MAFEKLKQKTPREIISVDSREDLIKQAPEIEELIEKLTGPDLTEAQFIEHIHAHNAIAAVPTGEVKRYSFTTENGRTIEIGADNDGRVGINYKL